MKFFPNEEEILTSNENEIILTTDHLWAKDRGSRSFIVAGYLKTGTDEKGYMLFS